METLALDHVVRAGSLPWRAPEGGFTECGLPVAEHPTITREELISRVNGWGRQRTALMTCMTCWETASRYKSWAVDPVDAVRREVLGGRSDPARFRQELWAIAALIEAHRTEFRRVPDWAGRHGAPRRAAPRPLTPSVE